MTSWYGHARDVVVRLGGVVQGVNHDGVKVERECEVSERKGVEGGELAIDCFRFTRKERS